MTASASRAWAAGFFDGEGNVNAYLKKGTNWYVIQLGITQIHRDTLERFQECIGGLGTIYGPYYTKTGKSGQYTLKIRNINNITLALSYMWPWLTPVKKEQALHAIRMTIQNPPSRKNKQRVLATV